VKTQSQGFAFKCANLCRYTEALCMRAVNQSVGRAIRHAVGPPYTLHPVVAPPPYVA
jgi:hypothetical protein